MDILDKLAQELFAALAHGNEAGVDISTSAAEALAEYERVRPRTVVMTFEKVDNSFLGKGLALLSVRNGLRATRSSVQDEYAYCRIPKLPGPEVFGKETET